MRRLHAAQKRALKDALSAASERQAYEQEASDAGRTAASAAVEEELERLHSQLALVQVSRIWQTVHSSGRWQCCSEQELATALEGWVHVPGTLLNSEAAGLGCGDTLFEAGNMEGGRC